MLGVVFLPGANSAVRNQLAEVMIMPWDYRNYRENEAHSSNAAKPARGLTTALASHTGRIHGALFSARFARLPGLKIQKQILAQLAKSTTDRLQHRAQPRQRPPLQPRRRRI